MIDTPQSFKSQPVKVQAMQFVGGAENATPIIHWVLSVNDSVARWTEEHAVVVSRVSETVTKEHLTVQNVFGSIRLLVGDWLVLGESENGDSMFVGISDEDFQKMYTLDASRTRKKA